MTKLVICCKYEKPKESQSRQKGTPESYSRCEKGSKGACKEEIMARRRKLAKPSASDLAEIARGKGSSRDKAEAHAFRIRKIKPRKGQR
jgi:hypothetical protein